MQPHHRLRPDQPAVYCLASRDIDPSGVRTRNPEPPDPESERVRECKRERKHKQKQKGERERERDRHAVGFGRGRLATDSSVDTARFRHRLRTLGLGRHSGKLTSTE